MTCYYPLDGWLASQANEASGKRPVVFSRNSASLDEPLQIPCGKCIGCRADQALMWSIRAYHESTQHLKNSFVTLTYSDENLPADGKIIKSDLQKFFKRLRRTGMKFRYIACGEYGDVTNRPHYHAIIFGQDFLHDKIELSESLYTSSDLTTIWGHGHVTIAPVTMSSICYVCGYVHKKLGSPDTFSLASRRPGIGHNWLRRYRLDCLRTGTVTIEGREYPVPPRYLSWEEDYLEPVKQQRKQYAKKLDPWQRRTDARQLEKNRKSLLKQRKESL